MKFLALGVTGGSGRTFVKLALEAGHQVVAIARRPEAVEIEHSNLKVVRGSVTDINTLASEMQDVDAVVSVLGVSKLLQARKGTKIYSESSRAIIEAMKRTGTKRLVVVSSGGIEPKASDNWFYTNVLKRFFLEAIYVDMRMMERQVRESDTDFTIIHPPYLAGDKERTDYRVAIDEEVENDTTLSRWSLGHFLLQVATDENYSKKMASVSY